MTLNHPSTLCLLCNTVLKCPWNIRFCLMAKLILLFPAIVPYPLSQPAFKETMESKD